MIDVIRRKIDRARVPLADGAPGADRGWRLALARATRDAMGLDLEFRRLKVTRASLAELLEIAPDRALVALLDGPQAGLGILMLDPSVTAALIEMQTIGRLSQQAPTLRKPTRIDAAMVAGVIDRALTGLEETLAEEADFVWAGGFRYASFLEDTRPLALLLEEESYRVLLADVALGGGDREGQVILILPANGRGERPELSDIGDEADIPHFANALAAQVLRVDSRLDAVIGRLTLPISQIMGLGPGDLLDLPLAGLDAISLETLEGRQVARARLGQNRGMRALKVLEAEVVRNSAPTSRPVMPAAVPPAVVAPEPGLRAAG
ncbi:FliM/FliN family flagellar motor switch protein [Tabrizicola sp.]|uniref:FliM/FliN family flagellar motor switch protein n=1 Tax=Tabrizicola sp. TaxID=2005166 RepID=UPI002609A965|nr:FliM/FliN family flagellar motor switch protein [Tabrizicola sp.]MDM7930932.1 FliM/FliN family flagellar motor switch protein [Tabrizicola sp.]